MTKQVTVRLPTDLVEFIDSSIELGEESSRAAVIGKALDRERRRRVAERDADIYARIEDDADDLNSLAEWAAAMPLDKLA